MLSVKHSCVHSLALNKYSRLSLLTFSIFVPAGEEVGREAEEVCRGQGTVGEGTGGKGAVPCQ